MRRRALRRRLEDAEVDLVTLADSLNQVALAVEACIDTGQPQKMKELQTVLRRERTYVATVIDRFELPQ